MDIRLPTTAMATASSGPAPHQDQNGLDSSPGLAQQHFSSEDKSRIRNMTVNRDIATKLQIMAKLSPISRVGTSANGTSAPDSDGTNHPFDVIGNTVTTPRSDAFHNFLNVSTNFEDVSPIPTPEEIDNAAGLPTLDSFETHVENSYLTLNSVNESLLVNEVTMYPKRRVQEMSFVGITKGEYLATKPAPIVITKIWQPYILRNIPNTATIDPRLTLLRPNPVFVHLPNDSDASWSDIDSWYIDEEDLYSESDDEEEYRLPRRFSFDYRTYADSSTPHANNVVMVPSSSPTPPNQIQTITKAGSNIRLALCILHRWFSNPLWDIAAIINKTFATGLDSKMCYRILRGAKTHRLDEYIEVYEETGWAEFNPHHSKVLRYLRQSADIIRVQLVPRQTEVQLVVVCPKPTS